jgi:hypothetical protein
MAANPIYYLELGHVELENWFIYRAIKYRGNTDAYRLLLKIREAHDRVDRLIARGDDLTTESSVRFYSGTLYGITIDLFGETLPL